MSSATNQGDSIHHGLRLAFPIHKCRIGPHHPLTIVCVPVDRNIAKGVTPFHKRTVIPVEEVIRSPSMNKARENYNGLIPSRHPARPIRQQKLLPLAYLLSLPPISPVPDSRQNLRVNRRKNRICWQQFIHLQRHFFIDSGAYKVRTNQYIYQIIEVPSSIQNRLTKTAQHRVHR